MAQTAEDKAAAAAEKATAEKAARERVIPVRALRLGWYGAKRYRAGDEFSVVGEQAVGRWMERLDQPAK